MKIRKRNSKSQSINTETKKISVRVRLLALFYFPNYKKNLFLGNEIFIKMVYHKEAEASRRPYKSNNKKFFHFNLAKKEIINTLKMP